MPEYKIDKGIPLTKKGYTKDVILQMDVGDSIFFTDHKKASAFRVSLHRYCEGGAIRKVEGGWRVWKTK